MNLNEEKGITLIEILVSLVIVSIIGGIIYGVLNQTIFAKEKVQSQNELRQEANLLMTQLRAMHEEGEVLSVSKEEKDGEFNYSLEEGLLFDKSKYSVKSITICELESDPKCKEPIEFETEQSYKFGEKRAVELNFTIKDNENHEYSLETTFISGIDEMSINITKPNYFDYLIEKDVFIYGSTFKFTENGNNPKVTGKDATMFVTENLDISKLSGLGKGEKSYLNISNIYLKNLYKPQSANIGTIGSNSNPGNIYIAGDIDIEKNVTFSGNLFVGGTVKPTSIEHTNWKNNNPKFYAYKIRDSEDWYKKHEYENGNEVKGNNKKVYNLSGSSNIQVKGSYSDVIVVSAKDITVSGVNVSGVLFAPNGTVSFKEGKFTGIIIAKEIIPVLTDINAPDSTSSYLKSHFNSKESFPLLEKINND